MKTIALIGQKGGSGKTTIASSLAVAFEMDGHKTRGLDLDPQASFTEWSDARGDYAPEVLPVLPVRLPKELERAKADQVEVCIIDTAGRAEQASMAALKAADLVIIPFRPTAKDLNTVEAVSDLLKAAGTPPAFAILTQVKPRGTRHTEAAELLAGAGFVVCPHVIGDRVSYQDPDILGQTPQEFEPTGAAAKEIEQVYKYTCELVNKSETQKG